jgi:cyclopropane fatty-acyl-phospholipid synthase-like methyltransferase
MLKDQMEKIYKDLPLDKIPWHMETPPEILQDIVNTEKIKPCRVIEFGCGAGNYVIYLASKGFDATGVDFSKTAIEIAKATASKMELDCNFISSDVLGDMAEIQDPFDFAYDWELLHHIFPEDRETYIHNVHRLLNPEGIYLSVCFSEKSPQFGGSGKYRKTPLDTLLYFSSESEIASLVEPLFETIELQTVEIKGKYAPHKTVYTFLKKRP